MLAEFRSCFPFSSQIAFFSLLSSSWSESFKIVSSLTNSVLSPSPADRRLACLAMVYFREVWCLQMDDCLWCFLRFSSVRGAGESPWLRVIHFFSHCLRLQLKFGLTIKYIFYTYPFHDYFTSILTVEQTRLVTGCVLSYKMISKRKRKVNKREKKSHPRWLYSLHGYPVRVSWERECQLTYANKTAHEIWGVGKNHLVLCILIAYFVFSSKFFINEKCELIKKPKWLVLST